jgi:hypothetical protein
LATTALARAFATHTGPVRVAPSFPLHSVSDPRDDYGVFEYKRPRTAPVSAASLSAAPAFRAGGASPGARVVLRSSLFSLSDPVFDYMQNEYPRRGRQA